VHRAAQKPPSKIYPVSRALEGKMKSRAPIAERRIFAIAPDGAIFNIHIFVGAPYKVSEEEWACAVGLEGLHSSLRDQHGIDSWQVLQLAYQLINQLLVYFIEDGGRLYWSKEGEPITLSELFPRLSGF